jgi:hypothetical protein
MTLWYRFLILHLSALRSSGIALALQSSFILSHGYPRSTEHVCCYGSLGNLGGILTYPTNCMG